MCALISGAQGQGLGKKVGQQGGWTIYRSQDAMTDQISCVATYKKDLSVQLSTDNLGFNLNGKGGVSGYTYRLDDTPATEMLLPSKIEGQAGVVILGKEKFSQVMQAKRLRMQVLTVLSSMVNYDIDLKESAAVIAFLGGPKCSK
jgi:hypothetical protein